MATSPNSEPQKPQHSDFAVWSAEHNHILTAPLPDPISKSIETITSLHTRTWRKVPAHQRILEKAAGFFARPTFLYLLVSSLILWLLGTCLSQAGVLPFPFPQFSWSEQGLDTAALLISTGVLVRQSRQENFAEQRAQLTLQLNLLSEQKIAKVIALIEELRHDLPDVHNRDDSEARIMQEAADPIVVLDALQENLNRELEAETPLITTKTTQP